MGYNPLSFIERYTDQSYPYNTQDIEMLAEYLCPIECDKDPFWDYSARMFMATLIAYVMEALPENEKHLGSVAEIQEFMAKSMFKTLITEWVTHFRKAMPCRNGSSTKARILPTKPTPASACS